MKNENHPDLIELTIITDYRGGHSFESKKIEDAITGTVLISPTSIASIEPNPFRLIDLQNTLVTLKENNSNAALSYKVMETVEEVRAILKDAAKRSLKLSRPVSYSLDRETRRGYFHRLITARHSDNGEEYALAVIEDADGSLYYIEVGRGDIKFLDKVKAAQPN